MPLEPKGGSVAAPTSIDRCCPIRWMKEEWHSKKEEVEVTSKKGGGVSVREVLGQSVLGTE